MTSSKTPLDTSLYFAKLLDITTHLCDHNCLISVKNYLDTFLVEDSICEQARNKFARSPTFLNIKFSNNDISVLLEFDQGMMVFSPPTQSSYDNMLLQFKKLSANAKAPVRATEGSVRYDLFSVGHKSIAPQECAAVATDITLVAPPGLYLRITPRSIMALKNTNIRADAVDIDEQG